MKFHSHMVLCEGKKAKSQNFELKWANISGRFGQTKSLVKFERNMAILHTSGRTTGQRSNLLARTVA